MNTRHTWEWDCGILFRKRIVIMRRRWNRRRDFALLVGLSMSPFVCLSPSCIVLKRQWQ